jgi:hypothetical protein
MQSLTRPRSQLIESLTTPWSSSLANPASDWRPRFHFFLRVSHKTPKEEVSFVYPQTKRKMWMFCSLPRSVLMVSKLNKRGSWAEPMHVKINDRRSACDVANDAAGGCYGGRGVGDLPWGESARNNPEAHHSAVGCLLCKHLHITPT